MSRTLDLENPKHAHADERLRTDTVIWLTTVDAHGQPQASPVWFLWEDGSFLIYSIPSSPKVPNIRAHPQVSLHLNDHAGEDVVSVEGGAEVTEPTGGAHPEAYVEKYRELIKDLGADPQSFAGLYSAAIRVTPTRFRVA
jgi:PPOX class probable F420-dependent enzyme